MKSCFFIGHREASSEILPALKDAVEQHIVEYGVTEFIVGHYGGFDRMAAKAVIEAKAQYPEITLSMLIPYHPAERPVELPPGFDNTFLPSRHGEGSSEAFHRPGKLLYGRSCGLPDYLCVASGK